MAERQLQCAGQTARQWQGPSLSHIDPTHVPLSSLPYPSLPPSLIPSPRHTTKVYRRQVLSNLSGVAHSGELVVVLGQSGSGKTSFLNVLSHRTPVNRGAQLSGRILLNGRVTDGRSMLAVSAYVEQDMSMFTYLTVEETLLLGAKVTDLEDPVMRAMHVAHVVPPHPLSRASNKSLQISKKFNLDPSTSEEDVNRAVSDVMQELGLSKVAKGLVGGAGCRGGEKRRVSLAKELFSNPRVLYLDEVTG